MITRAAALHASGQTVKALAEIDAVVGKDPNRARAFRARGEILRTSGKIGPALEALNQAIRLDPDNANGYDNRGNAFNNAGKYDRAIEDYNEALRLKPDFAQAWSDRGAAWYFKGEYQKAIADYDEAIRLDPQRRAGLHQPRCSLSASSAAPSARWMTTPRRSASIRPSRNFSTIAGCTLPPTAIIRLPSTTTTKRSSFIPSRNFLPIAATPTRRSRKRPRHRRLRCGLETGSQIPARLQQPWHGLAQKGDRARALQDYAEAIRLNPSDKIAADNHKEIALEAERLGALTSQKNLPSFNCATAKRQVEKAICADADLAQLTAHQRRLPASRSPRPVR